MRDLIPTLNTDLPVVEDAKTTDIDDALGSMLKGKWEQWAVTRRQIETRWLEDLMMFNQENEPEMRQLSKFHSHIYIGNARTKAMSAYSRLSDLFFSSNDRHWSTEPTPIPEDAANDPVNAQFMDEMTKRAEAMTEEIADQMVDLHYEDYLKSAILEGCIIGTGCVKGVVAGVKKLEKWGYTSTEDGTQEWDVIKSEVPAPQIDAPSVFNIYPDPYANRKEDMSGCFERHVLNRQQFSALKDDPRFDAAKIDEILSTTEKGNHVALWHETARRNIAKVSDSTATQSERFDLLEYWGQVSGRLLASAGVPDVEESGVYWAIVWTCSGKTLLAKIMPMKKQVIPYNFFIYNKVPHQFWGVSPVRMGRSSQLGINGVVRSILDGMAMVAVPMAEVNVSMLKDGQDPNVMLPGQTWLRDSGDPSVPAVRFFQPDIPTGQLIQMGEMFKSYADDETALPAYTYGNQGNEINDTAQGMSMQMNAASLPIKAVAKNLEDGCIKPLIESWFDWNMQWSDREDIKGDMNVQVLGTSALLAKEQKSQQLMQFLNLAANPLDAKYVDRKYLLTQIAKSMEIDVKKAVPDQMPQDEMPQPPQDSALDQAKAILTQAQTETEKATAAKIDAEKTETVIKSMFEAIQAANVVAGNPAIAPMSDSIFKSAGGKDYNGGELVDTSQPAQPMALGQNTHPNYPENPVSALPPAEQQPIMPPMQSADQGGMRGIETMRNEGVQ